MMKKENPWKNINDAFSALCDKKDARTMATEKRLYNSHEVAEIIADLFGDSCACNFNGIDGWLPFKCELLDCCPNTYGVACWEQYLKFRGEKMDGGNEDGK